MMGRSFVPRRALVCGLFAIAILASGMHHTALATDDEQVQRHRNRARGHYENEHFSLAAEEYREVVRLAPDGIIDWVNLCASECFAREDASARVDLDHAASLTQDYPHIHYMMGLTSLRLGEWAVALESYRQLLSVDPLCVPAYYGAGMAAQNLGQIDEAVALWERAIELEPDHGPSFYQLFRAYSSAGEAEKAEIAFEQFMRIKEGGLGPGTSRGKVEACRWLGAVLSPLETPRPGDPSKDIAVALSESTEDFGLASVVAARGMDMPASMDMADVDDDGDLDLLVGTKYFVNEDGVFRLGDRVPALAEDMPAARFADFDNDGTMDLIVGGRELVFLSGMEGGGFERVDLPVEGLEDAFAASQAWIHAIQVVDLDHEGDLDLLLSFGGDSAGIRILRNNGDRSFVDITQETQIGPWGGPYSKTIASDLECDYDVDLLFLSLSGEHTLWGNERDGTFKDITAASGLAEMGGVRAAEAGDLNNDGSPDLAVVSEDLSGVQLWMNDGNAGFHSDAGNTALRVLTGEAKVRSLQLMDLDNDGDLDLVCSGDRSLALRNDGLGQFTPWDLNGEFTAMSGVYWWFHGDYDSDGDPDLLAMDGNEELRVWRNEGGNTNQRIRFRLAGRKNTLDGIGSKVWIRDGLFFQIRETQERYIDLGIGARVRLDLVGLRWPTGVSQNTLDVTVGDPAVMEMIERPGLAESCPFVYAYDGDGFRFISDVLDATPLGVSLAPGVPFTAHHREALLIPGEALVEKDHLLSIRVTQELKEITYLDRLVLIAVDHPEEVSVFSNDRFQAPFPDAGIHLAPAPFPPVSATNEDGEDILESLLENDRVYAFDCPPIRIQYPGITREHSLILDPGDIPERDELWLYLRGTMLWPEASVNVAVSQNPSVEVRGVSLEVIDEDGNWVVARADLGVPAGMDKVLPVDLGGVYLTEDRRVRVTTNFAIIWDQALFAVGTELVTLEEAEYRTHLMPLRADLHYRGFSLIHSPDDNLPDLYDYSQTYEEPLFAETHSGLYTRYGEVVELLHAIDDRFVIMAPGDEITVEFPGAILSELPVGWTRDYILEVEGWIKDGDLRTVTGETVEPLPFHGMSAYPPPDGEFYPQDELHLRYLENYQTRILPRRPRSTRYP